MMILILFAVAVVAAGIALAVRAARRGVYEPESIEDVEHDTVMTMVNGVLTEVTDDASEVRK